MDFHWRSVSAFYSKAAGTGKWEKSRTMDDADSIDPDCAVYRMGGIRSNALEIPGHTRKHFGNVHLRLVRLEIIFQVSQKIKAFIC